MPTYIKPPIGAKPHWFVYRQRMEELNETISKYLEYIRQNQNTVESRLYYKAISQYAKEIQHLALLESELERM